MKIIDYFDRIYVINLPVCTDRLKSIRRELIRAGMPFKPGKVELFSAIKPDDPAGFIHASWRGCFLSHLNVLKLAKKEKLSNVLVMEDDLLIYRKFFRNQDLIVEYLNKYKWGFVYFAHSVKFHQNSYPKLIELSQDVCWTTFYGVNSTIFDRLIYFLEEYVEKIKANPPSINLGLDSVYSLFRRENKDIITLIATPALGTQGNFPHEVFRGSKKITLFYYLNLIKRLPVVKQLLYPLSLLIRWLTDT